MGRKGQLSTISRPSVRAIPYHHTYFFWLSMFSQAPVQGLANHKISGIKLKPSCPTISHLFFADDAILFLKANKEECAHILNTLEIYNAASGQLINFNKSRVSFSSNIAVALQQEICDLIGMPLLSKCTKYLGLPAFLGRSKVEAYNFLLERTLLKLQGWKQNQLTQAGKEITIKHVVQSDSLICNGMFCPIKEVLR